MIGLIIDIPILQLITTIEPWRDILQWIISHRSMLCNLYEREQMVDDIRMQRHDKTKYIVHIELSFRYFATSLFKLFHLLLRKEEMKLLPLNNVDIICILFPWLAYVYIFWTKCIDCKFWFNDMESWMISRYIFDIVFCPCFILHICCDSILQQ